MTFEIIRVNKRLGGNKINCLVARLVLLTALVVTTTYSFAQDQAAPAANPDSDADAATTPDTNTSNADTTTNTAQLNLDPPWDWLQLTSGEWLKGEIMAVEDFVVSFDSDKLNDLDIDWEDVRAIHTSRPMAVLMRDLNTAVGALQTRNGKIYIESQDLEIDFNDVINIATGAQRGRDLWTGDVGASTNIRKGNVNEEDLNVTADFIRRTITTELRLSYIGNFSEVEGVQTTNEHRGNLSYDYRWTATWFVRPVFLEYYRDPFQNLDSQWTVGFGGGYYLQEKYDQTWVVSAGPAYQSTKYKDVSADSDNPVSSAAFFMSTVYEQELTDDIDLNINYQVTLTKAEAGKAKHHFTVGLKVDITDSLDLNVSAYWDRTANPQPDDLGVFPEKNDFRFAVGLSFEL